MLKKIKIIMEISSKVKDWLYKKFISKGLQEVRKEARESGYSHGYYDAEKIYKEKEKHLSLLEKEWTIDPEEVVHITEAGLIFINGTQISDIEIKEIKAEARALKNFRIYKIFQETLKQKAVEKSVLQSKNFEEVLAGKMMIHSVGIIKSIVDLFDKYILK